jgi:hypothetical protein
LTKQPEEYFGRRIYSLDGCTHRHRSDGHQRSGPESRRGQGEEFVGPFLSWMNVKEPYGAAGDGVADGMLASNACSVSS